MTDDTRLGVPDKEPPAEPKPLDEALLLALGSHRRGGEPLTFDQEQLLDEWIAGRLPPENAERAAELTRRNTLAAERVLEARLLAAANEGPRVPLDLAARVLNRSRAPEPRRTPAFRLQWPRLGLWQWSGVGAAVAATIAVAVFGLQTWREAPRSDRIQIAMVTMDDRAAPRVRSLGPQTQPSPEGAYRDADIPADLLRRVIAAGTSGGERSIAGAELAPFLPTSTAIPGGRPRLLIDSAIANRLAADRSARNIPVRIYDLADARSAEIRRRVSAPPGEGPSFLLTLKP
jgi:hypothetical protein